MTFQKEITLFGFLVLSTPVLASNGYIPVLYNLSMLYGFSSIPGPVKELNITVENEKGHTVFTLRASLNEEGCIDSIDFNDKRKKSELILRRDGRSLKGVKDWSIINIALDDRCNIVSKTENGGLEEYITAKNGLLTMTRFMGNKVSEYTYNENGQINVTTFYSSRGVTASNTVTYRDSVHKPLDYKLINTSRYSENYATESVCQYDERGTPRECELIISFEEKPGKKPLRLKVMTEASFY